MDKVLLIDKPEGWTSFDVVAKIRSEIRKQANSEQPKANSSRLRVGHAGTLDPFATGLLIVLVGDATKKQGEYMKLDKEYEATFVLGATSDTDDKTGEIAIQNSSLRGVSSDEAISYIRDRHASLATTKKEIEYSLHEFTGEIEQVPPKYSAIKVDGKRAYKLARKDKDFKIKPRAVEIYKMKLVKYEYPLLSLTIKCSSGTYIRALARDLGIRLKTGAYVTSLRRTKIGAYSISDAKKLENSANINRLEK